MLPDCGHVLYTRQHRGEVMDTMVCLVCGATWPEFYGKHKTGSLLEMPNEHRPRSSQSFVIVPEGM